MSRFTPINFTTSFASAGGSVSVNQAMGLNVFDIGKILVVPSTGNGQSIVEIYKRNTFLASDRCYGTNPLAGNVFDPEELQSGNSPTERNEGFITPYEDLDAAQQLHLKITNNDVVSKTYSVTVWVAAQPLATSTGKFGYGNIAAARISERMVFANADHLAGVSADGLSTIKTIGLNASDQVSIAPGGQNTIFGSGVASGNLIQFGTSTDGLAGQHRLGRFSVINGDGSHNEVLMLGYNIDQGGGRISGNDTALALSLEGRYWEGGVTYTEAHLLFVDTDGVQYRPFYSRIRKGNRAAHDWQAAWHFDSMVWYDPSNPFTTSFFAVSRTGLTINPLDIDTGNTQHSQLQIFGDSTGATTLRGISSNSSCELKLERWWTIRIPSSVTNGLQIGDGSISSPVTQVIGPATGTDAGYAAFRNTGGGLLIGQNNSIGNVLGVTSAYAATINVPGTNDFYIIGNASNRAVLKGSTGAWLFSAPAAAPTLTNNGTWSLWLDEPGNKATLKCKYSDGTVKSGTVALT